MTSLFEWCDNQYSVSVMPKMWIFFPEKRMKGIFVCVLEFMLTKYSGFKDIVDLKINENCCKQTLASLP